MYINKMITAKREENGLPLGISGSFETSGSSKNVKSINHITCEVQGE